MQIVVIRHGETIENAANIIQGHQPGTLSAEGKRQAVNQGICLRGRYKPDVIYSSDLHRAVQTAEIIADVTGYQRAPVLDARLRERHYGPLEGQPFFQLKRLLVSQNTDIYNAAIEGAETYEQLILRAEHFFADVLASNSGQVFVVTHYGIIRYLLRDDISRVGNIIANCTALLFEDVGGKLFLKETIR